MTLVLVAASPVRPEFDRYARPGRLVRLDDGRRLDLRCTGAGRPTVLLESGLGFPSYSWRLVQPALARMTRTCSYDRAGLGFSDPALGPRSAAALADDLVRLISRARLGPEIVLVGSSLGGQVVRLVAFRHPGLVGGMVLVDPSVEGQDGALRAIAPVPAEVTADRRAAERACDADLADGRVAEAEAERCGCIDEPDPSFSPRLRAVTQRQRLDPATAATVASEREAMRTLNDAELADAAQPLGPMPLIVLTAGADFAGQLREQDLLATLRRFHRAAAAASTAGRERVVPGAGHVIQSTRPAAVIEAVVEVVAAVRADPALSAPAR